MSSTAARVPRTATRLVTRLGGWAVLIGTAITATVFIAWDGWYRWPQMGAFVASIGCLLVATFVVWLVGARRLPRPRWGDQFRDRRALFVALPFTFLASTGLMLLWQGRSSLVTSATTAMTIDRPDHAIARVLVAALIVFAGLLAESIMLPGDLLTGRSARLRQSVVVAIHALPVVLVGWAIAVAPSLPTEIPTVQIWLLGSVLLSLGVLLWLGGSLWLLLVADALSLLFVTTVLFGVLQPDDFDLSLVRIDGSSVAAIASLAAGSATALLALIAAAGIAPPPLSPLVARSFATIEGWLHSGEAR